MNATGKSLKLFACAAAWVAALAAAGDALPEVWVGDAPLRVEAARCSAMPVNIRWPGHQRELDQTEICSFARFDFNGPVEVCVTPRRDFTNVVVRPVAAKVAVPDEIDRDFYNHLMELKNNADARKAYLDSIRSRIGSENLAAAEARLNDVIAHAERLAGEHKIVEGDKWGNEPRPGATPAMSRLSFPTAGTRHSTGSRPSTSTT